MIQKIKMAGAAFLLTGMLTACGTDKTIYVETMETSEQTEETEQSVEESVREECYVYVCGAVNNPGVYVLASSARICEAVDAAGGFAAEAARTAVNQAERITDGQMILIPTETEYRKQMEQTEQGAQTAEEDGRIDLNRATMEELMSLPGVGQAKAAAIIAYRDKMGGFSSAEEIMQVEGIKEGVFNRMKDSIKVN